MSIIAVVVNDVVVGHVLHRVQTAVGYSKATAGSNAASTQAAGRLARRRP